jgi:antiviral helicase SKI2
MEFAREQLILLTDKLSMLQELYGIDVSESSKAGRSGSVLNFGLCAVVYEWARGTPFKDIITMTMVQEGSIVRCITRLDELCRDVRNAARALGNPSLYRKMEAASQCIKRDIVFAASLYVVG